MYLPFNFILHLHRRLDGVDGHQKDPEDRRGGAGAHRLDAHAHVGRSIVGVHQRQHARVGGGIPEAQERPLHERREDAAVEASLTTLSHFARDTPLSFYTLIQLYSPGGLIVVY